MDKENVDIGELYISVNKYSKDDRYFRISLSFYNVVTTLKVKNTFIIPIHSDIGPQVVGNPILEITDKLKRNYRVKLDAELSTITIFQLQFTTDKGAINSNIIDLQKILE